MALRKLQWTPKFVRKYRRLQAEAFANLDPGKDRPMQRFLRVGETLKVLAGVAGPPEDDRQLDTRPFSGTFWHGAIREDSSWITSPCGAHRLPHLLAA